MAVRLVGWIATIPLAVATMSALGSPAHAAPIVDWQDQPAVSSTELRVGEQVVGSIGSWSGDGVITYELRWELCDASYETPDCIVRSTLTTTDPAETLAYTPIPADNTARAGIGATQGADHRLLRFTVAATDADGTTEQFVQHRVRAGRLWETPRHSFFERGEATGMTQRQRWADAVAIAPDGTSTVIGGDLISFDDDTETAEYLYGAQQIGPDGDRGPVEQIHTSPRMTGTVGAAADDTGRVYVAYHRGDGPLEVTERDPLTGSWSAPQVLATADQVHRHGTLAADGAGHAVVWWVAPSGGDDPQELRIATRGQDGTWSTRAVDQPLSDPCQTGAYLDAIEEAVVDIGPDGDVSAVWARQHNSCYDSHPSHIADSVIAATYRINGTWTGVDQVVRLPGINGYRPEQLELTTAGAALTFSYTEFFDGTSNEGRRVNLYLLTAGANGHFPDLDPADPAGGGAATTLHRDMASAGGVSSPSGLALNDQGQFTVAWSAAPWGGDYYSIQATYGTLAAGAGATETVIANYRTGVGGPEVAIADNGNAAIVTDGRRGLFATRDAGASSWSEAQTVELADPQWAMMKQYATWPGDSISFDSSHRLWAAGLLGMDDRHFADIQWNHFGVTRLAARAGGLRGDIPHVDGPVGRKLTIEATNVVSSGDQSVAYAWDVDDDGRFDDGSGSTVEVTFDSPGNKPIAVRLATPDGDRAFIEGLAVVRENGAPWLHSIHWEPWQPVAGTAVTYTAIAHDDFDGDSLTYEWWIDDVEQTGETEKTLVRSLNPGQHEISVRATDLSGAVSNLSEATVTIQPAPVELHTLDVESLGAGDGTITSHPGGISCTPDCTEDYDNGTTVTLTATPDIGSRLDGWTGCDNEITAGTQCVVQLNADRDVSATFVQEDAPVPTRTLTVVKSGDGSGSVIGYGVDCGADCRAEYDDGTPITLIAVPAAGSVVTGWNGCDDFTGAVCEVTMDADRQVAASFARETAEVDTRITVQKVMSKKSKVRFAFEGSGGSGALSYRCRLDDGKFKSCTSPAVYRRITPGKHVFRVRAVDSTGVVDTTPAKAKFRLPRR